MTRQTLARLLKTTASSWSDHDAPRLGASLAYYALLSIAPLAVLTVKICTIIFKQTAEQKFLRVVADISGDSTAATVRMLLDSAHQANGFVATVTAVLVLLFGASAVFVELRDSLNAIWDAPKRRISTWRSLVWTRIVSFGMVLALGFLLLGSLILSAAATFAQKFLTDFMPLRWTVFTEVADFLLLLAALSILFGLIFKFVPDVPVYWRDVAIGAVATAVLFSIGKAALAFYLGTTAIGSTYGAAGSLVALVVWVYYSAQIFFFGAVFTRVYADTLGSKAAAQVRARAAKSSELANGAAQVEIP